LIVDVRPAFRKPLTDVTRIFTQPQNKCAIRIALQALYTQVLHTIGYAEFYSRSHDALIRVYDEAGNVVKTHEHTGDFREP
jgi:hypothetical protein